MTPLRLGCVLLLIAASLAPAGAAPSSEPMTSTAAAAPVWRTDVTGRRVDNLPLLSLVPGGTAQSVKLTGLANFQCFDFGVRADDLVSEAALELRFTPSPAVVPEVSQINVYLNGQLQQSVRVEKDMPGKASSARVALNPKSIKGQNQVSLEFIGHYTTSTCENRENPSLWIDVAQESRLTLAKQRVRVANDISKFPSPFVDTNTTAATTLPMVFAAAPNAGEKQAAAVLASIVGRLAAWRGADFPVYFEDRPAESHFAVFATNFRHPAFLYDWQPVDGPQVWIADAPGTLASKMLVIAGRDEEDLITAAKALALEGHVTIGSRLKVKNFEEPPARAPYDAPNWINTGSEIPFSRLMQYPGQLSSRGYSMQPVHLPVKLAPDLFMVNDARVSMSVKYRYTKPMPGETAQLRTFINGFLADSENIASSESAGTRLVALPGYYGPLAADGTMGLALAAANDISFSVGYERSTPVGSADNCRSVTLLMHQMEIEPSSLLSIKGLFHYAVLPDLGLYARSGYPFTVRADLAETAIVIADDAPQGEVRTMLNAVARMASDTGAAASRVTVAPSINAEGVKGKDILYIGKMPAVLTDINKPGAEKLHEAVLDEVKGEPHETASEIISDNGLAAIIGAESPFSPGRSLVALVVEGASGSIVLNRRLAKPSDLASLRGAVSIITADETHEFRTGKSYSVSDMPWYRKVWFKVGRHPGWLVLCALLSAVMVGFAIFVFMRRWVRGRE